MLVSLLRVLVQVPAALILIALPENLPEKTRGDGPSDWGGPVIHVREQDGIPDSWLLPVSGRGEQRPFGD